MEYKANNSSTRLGKGKEYLIFSQMLNEGLDLYLPLVDDDAIDVVVKRPDGVYVEVQIKATTKNAKKAALFTVKNHQDRKNYWFVFYSELLHKMWIMSSKEFLKEATPKKDGRYSIEFNGGKSNCLDATPKKEKYLAETFDRIKRDNPNKEAR